MNPDTRPAPFARLPVSIVHSSLVCVDLSTLAAHGICRSHLQQVLPRSMHMTGDDQDLMCGSASRAGEG